MKKHLLLSLLLLTSLNNANAKSGFYAGIDIQRQNLQLKTDEVELGDGSIFKPSISKFYETKSYNPNLFLGYNLNKNLDIELGYSMSNEDKKNNSTGLYLVDVSGNLYNFNTKSNIKTQNIALDIKPSYQIDGNNSIYGILGLTYLKFELKEIFYANSIKLETTKNSKNIIAPTVGFGYKLKINDDFSVRSQFKYSYLNKEIGDSYVKANSMTNLALGIAYNF